MKKFKHHMYKYAIAIMIAALLSLTGCSNSEAARQQERNQSRNEYGVLRTVTAYAQSGEKIGEWQGKIDVEYEYGSDGAAERVDILIFDGSDVIDRIIISGAIVIVDND